MVLDQQSRNRKETGAKYKKQHAKRKHALGRDPTFTKVDKAQATKVVRGRGGNEKRRLLRASEANVYDPKAKKYIKAKVELVLENPANRHFVRRNIITKGTILKTDKGNARVTSRPGQEGVINAVLV